MRGLLTVSNALDKLLRWVAHAGAWFFILCMVTICFDVFTRKVGYQLSLFGISLGSTPLQELEWHWHAMLLLTWLGYAYVRNAHVRIDVLTGGLNARKQAWLELYGCIFFAIPYLAVALPGAHDFFWLAWTQNESSAAPNGLPNRWIVKAFLYFGFLSVLFAVISVMLRRIVFLFGSPDIAKEAMPDATSSAH